VPDCLVLNKCFETKSQAKISPPQLFRCAARRGHPRRKLERPPFKGLEVMLEISLAEYGEECQRRLILSCPNRYSKYGKALLHDNPFGD